MMKIVNLILTGFLSLGACVLPVEEREGIDDEFVEGEVPEGFDVEPYEKPDVAPPETSDAESKGPINWCTKNEFVADAWCFNDCVAVTPNNCGAFQFNLKCKKRYYDVWRNEFDQLQYFQTYWEWVTGCTNGWYNNCPGFCG